MLNSFNYNRVQLIDSCLQSYFYITIILGEDNAELNRANNQEYKQLKDAIIKPKLFYCFVITVYVHVCIVCVPIFILAPRSSVFTMQSYTSNCTCEYVNVLEREIEHHKGKIAILEENKADQERHANTLEGKLSTEKQHVSTLKEKILSLERIKATQDSKIAKLEKEVEEVEEANEELRTFSRYFDFLNDPQHREKIIMSVFLLFLVVFCCGPCGCCSCIPCCGRRKTSRELVRKEEDDTMFGVMYQGGKVMYNYGCLQVAVVRIELLLCVHKL